MSVINNLADQVLLQHALTECLATWATNMNKMRLHS